MKFIKLIFKIIAAPFVVLLTIVTLMIEFVFCYAAALLQVVSGIGVLISIALLVSGTVKSGTKMKDVHSISQSFERSLDKHTPCMLFCFHTQCM